MGGWEQFSAGQTIQGTSGNLAGNVGIGIGILCKDAHNRPKMLSYLKSINIVTSVHLYALQNTFANAPFGVTVSINSCRPEPCSTLTPPLPTNAHGN